MERKMQIGEHETTYDSLSEEEIKGIIDSSLDEKLSKLEIPETFDADAFKTDILDSVTNLFKEQQTKSDKALNDKLGKLFEDKLSNALKGLGNGKTPTEKGPGFLTRFLAGSTDGI
jgi:hypothetical protein